jgi:cell division protein FtsQ
VSPIAAPADRRFRRSHVKPTRRRRRFSLLKPLVKYGGAAALSLFGLYEIASTVATASVLEVDSILVEGNRRMSRTQVLDALHGLTGENILLTDIEGWRTTLLKAPWVKDAALRRSLPSTIQVLVSERAPMAIGRLGDALYLVDEHGTVIDEYGPAYGDLDLPIVDGLGTKRAQPGATTDGRKAALAARVIAGLAVKPAVATRLAQIDVRDSRNAAVMLSGDAALLYIGDDKFLPRIESYVELAPKLREFVPDIDYVDLRFGDQVIVRPARGAARTVVRTGSEEFASLEGAPPPRAERRTRR